MGRSSRGGGTKFRPLLIDLGMHATIFGVIGSLTLKRRRRKAAALSLKRLIEWRLASHVND